MQKETEDGIPIDAGKSDICSESVCREETKQGIPIDAGKSGASGKGGCREEGFGSGFAEVIVDIYAENLDHPFTYRIPPSLSGRVVLGARVKIPFRTREVFGYVVRLADTCDLPGEKVRDILEVATDEETTEGRLVALAAFMSRTYGGVMALSLRTVFPARRKVASVKVRHVYLCDPRQVPAYKARLTSRQASRKKVLDALLLEDGQSAERLRDEQGASLAILRGLEQDGMVRLVQKEELRLLTRDYSSNANNGDSRRVVHAPALSDNTAERTGDADVLLEETAHTFSLTQEQASAVRAIRREWENGAGRPVLLTGITGSGKTLVYMELIADTLKKGRQAIVLIPEIALTDQTVRRFVARFGEKVSFLHSRLSEGERYDQMRAARNGQVEVMVGPRSALFAPFENLGLIVIDEEHEDSYRSERTPRYDARETARERARLWGAHLILGSATPSVAAAFAEKCGEYLGVSLKNRYGGASLPKTVIVDMREELRAGNRSMFSGLLRKKLEETLSRGEQAMLFLNRRGYAGFVSCRACGHVMKCPHCDVSLTLHRDGTLRCHYCGHREPKVDKCPVCGSPFIGGLSVGTQQVEEALGRLLPDARILRMDLDTTSGKEGHGRVLGAFARGEADVLVGTQMIVKGHDFANVTLVGALMADLSLAAPDFRSGERTFSLLAQAVGRAGRGKKPGLAIIQTYQPEHYAIRCAAAQAYEPFFEEEISFRRLMAYPPCGRLLAILGSAESEETLSTAMAYLRKYVERIDPENRLHALGPAPQRIGKIMDRYQMALYLRHEKADILIRARQMIERYVEINRGFDAVRLEYDMNG